jgi:hypothetical protein
VGLLGWAKVPVLGVGADHPLPGAGFQVEVTASCPQDDGFVGTQLLFA